MPKGFRSDMVMLISKDENLTKSHAGFVAACLIWCAVFSSPGWALPKT
jgi:hypothetical protein